MTRWLFAPLVLALASTAAAQITTTTFDNPGLSLGTYLNNAGPTGQFAFDGNTFNNVYDSTYGVWSGWAIVAGTDTTTLDFSNQYSAITGSGAGGSSTYAMAFTFAYPTDDVFHPADSWIDLAPGTSPLSIDVTNATYTYLAMVQGYQQARIFGAGDYLTLDIQGYRGADGTGQKLGEIDFDLARYVNADSKPLGVWQTLDLASLAGARSLRFGLRSSDNDSSYGMNTPAYFAIDNLRVQAVPEPSTLVLAGLALVATCGLIRRRPKARAE